MKALKIAALLASAAGVAAVAVTVANALGTDTIDPRSPTPQSGPLAAAAQNAHLSSPVLMRYWLAHPDQAPDSARYAITQLKRVTGADGSGPALGGPRPAIPTVAFGHRFNGETTGMPQNEESLAKCGAGVLGGTNDYRGFLTSPTGDGTGWEYSADGGDTLLKEGDLPGVTTFDYYVPSQGDPTTTARNLGGGCVFYAASLNISLDYQGPSAIVAYRTPKSKLDGSCTGFDCWPTRKVVVRYRHQYAQLADKEWIATGPAEGGGSQVVIVYTLFDLNEVSIRAVICDEALTTCGSPMRLDGASNESGDYVQFPYVSVGPTGKIYVTWVYWKLDGNTFRYTTALIKGSVYSGGTWGPTTTIQTENQPIAQGSFRLLGLWHRIATQAKGAVSPAGRWFVVWDRCGVPNTILSECDNADILGRYSDDDGATWSSVIPVNTNGGHQFFPSQPAFGNASNLVIAYYTTEYGRAGDGFDSRYDVAARFSTNASSVTPTFGTVRVTSKPSNPLSDWWDLAPFFIGDYISAVAEPGVGYVHYNAEYTKLVPDYPGCDDPGACDPANQQDNYLSKFTFP